MIIKTDEEGRNFLSALINKSLACQPFTINEVTTLAAAVVGIAPLDVKKKKKEEDDE